MRRRVRANLCGAHEQHRHGRAAHDLLCVAAHQQAPDSAPAVGSENDEISLPCLRLGDDDFRRARRKAFHLKRVDRHTGCDGTGFAVHENALADLLDPRQNVVRVRGSGLETGATYTHDVLPRIKKVGESILMDGKARAVAAGVTVDTLQVECFATRTSEIVIAQAQTWKADLIVLGTHGRRGIGRLLMGSDAEQIVRGATVPVLLVRAAEVGADTSAHGAARMVALPAKGIAIAMV